MKYGEMCRRRMEEMPHSKVHAAAVRVRIVERMFKKLVEHKVMGTGVYRSQHQLLMNLCFQPDMSQTELAEKMEVSPAAVAVSLKKLEKGGYVRREIKENDNRVNRIVITDKGKEIINQSAVIFDEIDNSLFAGFTEKDLDSINDYLNRMYQNLVEYEEKCCLTDKSAQQ